jgi:lysophospholipase L1-like esterase
MQFDDAFPKRIERILNLAHPGEKRAEVINFGKMGLSTKREVEQVARALGHNPDLILLEITLNDAELTNFHTEQKKHPGKFNFGEVKVTAENHPLLVHFHGLSFLYERLHRIGATGSVADYYVQGFKNPENRRVFQQSLSEIKALTDKAGVRLAVVIFPMFYTDIDDGYPFAEIHTMIHDDLNARSIQFVDIRSEFTGIPHTRLNVMVGKDTHPNEIAHRIAADAIYRWLLDQELIPAELKAPIQDISESSNRHHRHRQDKTK